MNSTGTADTSTGALLHAICYRCCRLPLLLVFYASRWGKLSSPVAGSGGALACAAAAAAAVGGIGSIMPVPKSSANVLGPPSDGAAASARSRTPTSAASAPAPSMPSSGREPGWESGGWSDSKATTWSKADALGEFPPKLGAQPPAGGGPVCVGGCSAGNRSAGERGPKECSAALSGLSDCCCPGDVSVGLASLAGASPFWTPAPDLKSEYSALASAPDPPPRAADCGINTLLVLAVKPVSRGASASAAAGRPVLVPVWGLPGAPATCDCWAEAEPVALGSAEAPPAAMRPAHGGRGRPSSAAPLVLAWPAPPPSDPTASALLNIMALVSTPPPARSGGSAPAPLSLSPPLPTALVGSGGVRLAPGSGEGASDADRPA
mmetsp:Transcript_32023/g.95663  ORF Transcript_32023/g.95663 Transcript_32023/m.95663 type:complete len:378 (-) Transcript_32023:475-1608(-)